MESDHHHQQQQQQHHHHQQPPAANPGLTRFRSAPSSFFNIVESVPEREFWEDLLNRPSSPETGQILSRLMSGDLDDPTPPPVTAAQNLGNLRQNCPPRSEAAALRPHLAGMIKSEPKVLQRNDFSSAPHYQSSPQPPLPNWTTTYGAVKMGRGNNSSNLIRQSSSPAGLFSNINVDSGYNTMRGMGGALGAAKIERRLPQATRFGNHQDSLTRVSSSVVQMTPIAEVGDRTMGDNTPEVDPFVESNDFVMGCPMGSWDDSENYSSLKRGRGEDEKNSPGLNASDALNENVRSGTPQMLAHHLSLPKSSAEVAAFEKILQDSVPCKIRAKRGCATHPRSIAERVRRTKISERMRKLQDLVPNMDRQTNTADMLDLAVEYIKDLQQQVKVRAVIFKVLLYLDRTHLSLRTISLTPRCLILIRCSRRIGLPALARVSTSYSIASSTHVQNLLKPQKREPELNGTEPKPKPKRRCTSYFRYRDLQRRDCTVALFIEGTGGGVFKRGARMGPKPVKLSPVIVGGNK